MELQGWLLISTLLHLGFAKPHLQDDSNFECFTVTEGDFYAFPMDLPSFHSNGTMIAEVNLNNDTTSYIFQSDYDMGHLCESSWNKLYGGSRCGYIHPHHEDSDRFAWRRHQDCLIYKGNYVVGEVPNCPYKDLIQICAYAYDRSNKPFQNASLLTIFDSFLTAGETYTLKIQSLPTSSVYEVFTSVAAGMKLIESHTIEHTYCEDYGEGYDLGLYFGGECAAPQEVGICYNYLEG
eukprot:TRINITY_DN7354_c0_g1_i1.p1 TRINITY_DN7354_c0_g1~~TRINITY_DN7354_c0_g1_i1.p1  ORF type:complete len:236 (-),score=20.98 TRINITY_DN7354_c0_g1_i1:39-746(-)